jgi:hypothetical protein
LEKKPKPNRNRVKPTGFGSVWFGFLGKKPVQTGLARFFRFWLGFFGLAQFFRFGSVLARFFPVFCRFWFGSVQFFQFFCYKTETEPAGFFKKLIGLIGFFFGSVFLVFFFRFSRFNRFSGFFAHPYLQCLLLSCTFTVIQVYEVTNMSVILSI